MKITVESDLTPGLTDFLAGLAQAEPASTTFGNRLYNAHAAFGNGASATAPLPSGL